MKITVLLDLAWSKMGSSNLLHPPTSTLNLRSWNHLCVVCILKIHLFAQWWWWSMWWAHNSNINIHLWFIGAQNETHPPMEVIPAIQHATKSMLLTFWYTANKKSKVAEKFESEQMYLHPIWFLWANVLASNLICWYWAIKMIWTCSRIFKYG